MHGSLIELSVIHVASDALLRLGDLFDLADKAGHEAKHHGQQQRGRRDRFAEQVHELVRCHNDIEYGEPGYNSGQHDTGPDPIQDGFQSDWVTVLHIEEHGCARMAEQRVDDRHQQTGRKHGEEEYLHRLLSFQVDSICHGTDQRNHQKYRVHKEHGQPDYNYEIDEINNGMVCGKCIHCVPLY